MVVEPEGGYIEGGYIATACVYDASRMASATATFPAYAMYSLRLSTEERLGWVASRRFSNFVEMLSA